MQTGIEGWTLYYKSDNVDVSLRSKDLDLAGIGRGPSLVWIITTVLKKVLSSESLDCLNTRFFLVGDRLQLGHLPRAKGPMVGWFLGTTGPAGVRFPDTLAEPVPAGPGPSQDAAPRSSPPKAGYPEDGSRQASEAAGMCLPHRHLWNVLEASESTAGPMGKMGPFCCIKGACSEGKGPWCPSSRGPWRPPRGQWVLCLTRQWSWCPSGLLAPTHSPLHSLASPSSLQELPWPGPVGVGSGLWAGPGPAGLQAVTAQFPEGHHGATRQTMAPGGPCGDWLGN